MPFATPPVYVALLSIPAIDAFGLCAFDLNLGLTMIPTSLATAFGAWSRSFQPLAYNAEGW
jgi:hypothetical protein